LKTKAKRKQIDWLRVKQKESVKEYVKKTREKAAKMKGGIPMVWVVLGEESTICLCPGEMGKRLTIPNQTKKCRRNQLHDCRETWNQLSAELLAI
jgi:hypothetical protein